MANDATAFGNNIAKMIGAAFCDHSTATVIAHEGECFSASWPNAESLETAPPMMVAAIAASGVLFDIARHETIDLTTATTAEMLGEIEESAEVEFDPMTDAAWLTEAFERSGRDEAMIETALDIGRRAAIMALQFYMERRGAVDAVAKAVTKLPNDGSQGYLIEVSDIARSMKGEPLRAKHCHILRREGMVQ